MDHQCSTSTTNLTTEYQAMTAEQVRERKWTDEELDYLTATEVLGWTDEDWGDSGGKVYKKKNGEIDLSWHPSTDMNDAMVVAGELVKDIAETMQLTYHEEFATALFEWRDETIETNRSVYWQDRDANAPRAICIASLIAMKEKK